MEHAENKLLALQLQGQVNITKNNIVQLKIAAGQDGQKEREMFKHGTKLGGTFTYCYTTTFGPLSASVGYSNVSREFYYYANFGFEF